MAVPRTPQLSKMNLLHRPLLRMAPRKNAAEDAAAAGDAIAKEWHQHLLDCRARPSLNQARQQNQSHVLREAPPGLKRAPRLISTRTSNELNLTQTRYLRCLLPLERSAHRLRCLLDDRLLSSLPQCCRRNAPPTAVRGIRPLRRDCRASNPCCDAWSRALCTTSIRPRRRPRGREFSYCRTPIKSRHITWRLVRRCASVLEIWREVREAAKHRAGTAVDIPIQAA